MTYLGHFATHLEHLSHLSYWGIFVALVASGHVVPVPESVTLILLGYLVAFGKLSLWKIFLVGTASTFVFDLVFYLISFGGGALAVRLSKGVKQSLIDRYRGAEEKHLFGLVFASHFVPGWRLANPIIAGITRMPWKKFVLYSFFTDLVYSVLFISFGFYSSGRITRIIGALSSVQHMFLIVIVVALVLGLIVYNMRHAEK